MQHPLESEIIPSTDPTFTTRNGQSTQLDDAPREEALSVSDLDASRLVVEIAQGSKFVPAQDSAEAWSCSHVSDHMLAVHWSVDAGWGQPRIQPFGPLQMLPTASCLHYATECFEGMKAYRGMDGKVRLFRPERNVQRLLKSAARISLPGFSPTEFLKLLTRLVAIEAPRWLPEPGRFLYIRPAMIGTGSALGMSKPKEAHLFVVLAVFPDLTKRLPPTMRLQSPAALSKDKSPVKDESKVVVGKPVQMRLICSQKDTLRAWPGGFGDAKVGANYGPTIRSHVEASQAGYHQVLWLFGDEQYVTEAGGSNFFAVWKAPDTGRLELITAPLDQGIILEGVTRASVLEVARQQLPEITVVERHFTIHEMLHAHDDGRLLETFAVGTAVFVAPVGEIRFGNVDIVLKMGTDGAKYSTFLSRYLKNIMFGNVVHDWAVEVQEEKIVANEVATKSTGIIV